MRIKAEFQTPLAEGRLLMLSPFPLKEIRMTAATAVTRNRFVAATADEVFVAHAAAGGKTEDLCRDILAWGKQLTTFGCFANNNLFLLGAGGLG
jgi:predicted Rossmann fold nucleotide-binding protein DprA/Smf involved in DNA uptake